MTMSTPLDLRNVAWMALSMMLVTLPHFERLPLWITSLAMLTIAWRVYIAWQVSVLPRGARTFSRGFMFRTILVLASVVVHEPWETACRASAVYLPS